MAGVQFFGGGSFGDDPDVLQDHCVIMFKKTQGMEGNLPLRQKKI